MKVTAIEEQKKRKERVSVFIDNQFAFGLHIDVLLDYHLKVGTELDETKIAQIKTSDAFRQTYDKAIGFLARRPRSSQEVRHYLQDKLIYHHDDYAGLASSLDKEQFVAQQQASINQIIDRLTEQQLIDDVAFAKWWIDNRRQFKPRGQRLLLLELKAKGITNTDIATALTTPDEEGHFSGQAQTYSEAAAALELAQKYLKKHPSLAPAEQQPKLNRYLASKGFDWDTIAEVNQQLKP